MNIFQMLLDESRRGQAEMLIEAFANADRRYKMPDKYVDMLGKMTLGDMANET